MIRLRTLGLTFWILWLFPRQSLGQVVSHPVDSIQVTQTMAEFIDAFSNLKWDKFIAFFADDATAFFPPSANYPYRANNKIEIARIFKALFDTVKARKSSPPYLSIHPKDLRIQILNSMAIVTFTLDDPGMVGRRTIILEKRNDIWLIIHLHASGAAFRK
jgi:ketosteroid isomerase-like protein